MWRDMIPAVALTAKQLEDKNRALKQQLLQIKHMPKPELEDTIRRLEEQNRYILYISIYIYIYLLFPSYT